MTIITKKKLGELLVERGLITGDQLELGLKEQKRTGLRLGEILLQQGIISEDQLINTVSERLSIPRLKIDSMVIDPNIIRIVSVELARRYTVIPVFAIGSTLTLAMADPLNIIAIDEIKYRTGHNINRAVASAREIRNAIDQYYSVADSISHIIGIGDDLEESGKIDSSVISETETESAVVKLVNLIINKAVKEKASDIHVEPEESRLRIRYRIHGAMREEASPPKSMQNEFISRIKIAANLDVSEKRLPQDGRFMMSVEGSPIDLRVSTLPTIHGEKIVIRILDRRNLLLSLTDLGFTETMVETWNHLVHQPEGLLLISGPTSSGKTSTLYSTLQVISSVEKNIITVEDPVEYSLPLIIQVQINERAGLTFPSTLRSMLRQNPDIIMIGEIRDRETAQMAVRSSLTGHLVFSTIHTNDAPSAITRLSDMGLENYLVATSLKGILAQRLVRVNCPECRTTYKPSEEVLQRAGLLDLADVYEFYRSSGCPQCRNTGFKGQTGIFELIQITPDISEMIMRGASGREIKDAARHNRYVPLFEMGLGKIRNGIISLEELLKETYNFEDYFDPIRAAAVTVTHADPL